MIADAGGNRSYEAVEPDPDGRGLRSMDVDETDFMDMPSSVREDAFYYGPHQTSQRMREVGGGGAYVHRRYSNAAYEVGQSPEMSDHIIQAFGAGSRPLMSASNTPAFPSGARSTMSTANTPAFDTGPRPTTSTTNTPSFDTGPGPSMSTTNTPSFDTGHRPTMSTTNTPSFDTGQRSTMSTTNTPSFDTGPRPTISASGNPVRVSADPSSRIRSRFHYDPMGNQWPRGEIVLAELDSEISHLKAMDPRQLVQHQTSGVKLVTASISEAYDGAEPGYMRRIAIMGTYGTSPMSPFHVQYASRGERANGDPVASITILPKYGLVQFAILEHLAGQARAYASARALLSGSVFQGVLVAFEELNRFFKVYRFDWCETSGLEVCY